MRYCPLRKQIVSDNTCRDCLLYQPERINNPCIYKEKDKCDNCKENK